MGLFVIVQERVEFPCPGSGVGFAVGCNVVCGLKFGCKLNFCFGSSVVLRHAGVGIGEYFGVVLLLRGLVLLVGFFACPVELFAVSHVEVAGVDSSELSVDFVDA